MCPTPLDKQEGPQQATHGANDDDHYPDHHQHRRHRYGLDLQFNSEAKG